jgi:hypothetical protein
MPRGLIVALAFVASACGAMWPPTMGDSHLKSASPAASPFAQAQAEEYGFVAAEKADYGAFQVTALQFKDPTGAYAAALAAPGSIRVGNYVVVNCEGKCPKNVAALADASLPHVSRASVPSLSDYLPSKGLVPHSQLYILGPASLSAAAPEIPAPAVKFDFSTEGEVARYRTASGQATLAVFSFATPSLARQQLPQFQQIPKAAVKRSGPLVAVAIGASPANSQLLKAIEYEGVVEENEKPPDKPLELKPESAGKMILSILSLAGLLLAFCLISGLAVGGSLRLARKFGYSGAEGSLITLHLEGQITPRISPP